MSVYYLYQNFGGLCEEFSDYEKAKVVVMPFPYEVSSSHMTGTRKGPGAIISASPYLEWYDEETDYEPYTAGIHTMPEIQLSKNSIPEAMEEIESCVRKIVRDEKFPVVLGGEHSISYAVVRAIAESYTGLSVLYLDAHGDLRDEYDGTKFSHACASRRIREICPDMVQVGVRSICLEEANYIRNQGLRQIYMARDQKKYDIEQMISGLSENVYISVDIDVFDPGQMPSVGAPEPGGLDWYQVTDILKECFTKKNVVGCDLVELSPLDGHFASSFMAASLVYKMIAYKYMNK